MMKKTGPKRSRQDITASIIRCCSMPNIGLTRVMFNCNLSYTQVKDYVQDAIEMQFIERKTGGDITTYRTTDAGRKFLDAYFELLKLYGGRIDY